MANLPFPYAEIDSRLRGDGVSLCATMRVYLRDNGVDTSNWRFDAETQLRMQTSATDGKLCAQPVVEFTLQRGDERRKVLFVGPAFVWEPTIFTKVTPVAAMPQEMVREFFEKIHDARDALVRVLQEPQAMGLGLVPWYQYDHQSDLMCLLTGVPEPTVLDVPIEDVLPTGCIIHLVDEGGDRARDAARAAYDAVKRRGQNAAWFHNPQGDASEFGLQPRCVEEAIQHWMMLMGATDPVTSDPTPPGLIVFAQPSLIPMREDLYTPGRYPAVGPGAAVMWANVLPQVLLKDTTLIAFHSVDGISEYPDTVAADMQPWRANAKYERVYRAPE
jgi:hypothetical protein